MLTPPDWVPIFWESDEAQAKENGLNFIKQNKIFLISRLAALAFGIYLSSQIAPFIITALAATGFAYGLAVFTALFASLLLIYVTDLAFNLPALIVRVFIKLMDLSWNRNSLFGRNNDEGFNDHLLWFNLFFLILIIPQNVTALISVCSALSAVLPGVPYGLVVFTALAVGLALLFFLLRSLQFLAAFVFKAGSASWEAIKEWRAQRRASLDAGLRSEPSSASAVNPTISHQSRPTGDGHTPQGSEVSAVTPLIHASQ